MYFISFSEKECMTDFRMTQPDSHSFYEIYFLTSGTRRLIISNRAYELTAPIVAVIPPFTPHLTEGGAYTRINIYLSPNTFYNVDTLILKDIPCFFKLGGNEKTILQETLHTACKFDGDTEYKRAFCLSALAMIKSFGSPIESSDIAAKNDAPFSGLIEYINDNFTNGVSLSELCDKFYYTKNTLCRQFKKHMNCTVNDYILLLKINKAKNMLYETKKSIQEISDECGFSSSNYFSLIFTRRSGISPSEFRKTL